MRFLCARRNESEILYLANVWKFYYHKWQPKMSVETGKWFSVVRMTSIEMDYIALACVIFLVWRIFEPSYDGLNFLIIHLLTYTHTRCIHFELIGPETEPESKRYRFRWNQLKWCIRHFVLFKWIKKEETATWRHQSTSQACVFPGLNHPFFPSRHPSNRRHTSINHNLPVHLYQFVEWNSLTLQWAPIYSY